jgi:hypothetical protein
MIEEKIQTRDYNMIEEKIQTRDFNLASLLNFNILLSSKFISTVRLLLDPLCSNSTKLEIELFFYNRNLTFNDIKYVCFRKFNTIINNIKKLTHKFQ